ncbi:hypothetical protein EDC30_104305 [Paucimonas lemoignei]|uniref:Holin (3TMs family) n=1 Tax=Paucimonas lemoignei TaxID=29443 RepID=A0A4R3HYV0_PAULE|nr:hypothetical protein [Paucimonas lemoignei]TCS37501.1 hypothetical protein EDC30_104305 [Paucimonas lemoignei]
MDPVTILMGLAQFAPAVIKWATGSDKAEEVAGKVIDVAKAVTGRDTPDAALAAIQADPALAIEFRKAVMANELEYDRMFLADVQSARDRDIKMAAAGNRNYRANVLAGMAILLVIVCLMVVVWMSDLDDYAKGTITLICGRALGWVEQIFSFEFGTTRSSKTKDDTISRLSGS